jgi:hypothetical protein
MTVKMFNISICGNLPKLPDAKVRELSVESAGAPANYGTPMAHEVADGGILGEPGPRAYRGDLRYLRPLPFEVEPHPLIGL